MSKKKVYSDDERVIRIWDIETVKDLMSRRQVMQMNNDRRAELETLWVKEPAHQATASLGSNWGYYVGMPEIERFYVAEYTEKLQKALEEKCAANSQLQNIRDSFGYGDLIAHHVSTPLRGAGRRWKDGQGRMVFAGRRVYWQSRWHLQGHVVSGAGLRRLCKGK